MGIFASANFLGDDGTTLDVLDSEFSDIGVARAYNLAVANNRLRILLSTGTAGAVHSGNAVSADMTARCTLHCLSAVSTQPGLVVRYSSSSNYYFARFDYAAQICEMFKVVSGSITSIGSAAFALSTGQVAEFAFEGVGSNLRVLRDGVAALSVSDASLASGTKAGIRYSTSAAVGLTTGTHIDDFEAYDGAYSAGAPPAGTVTIGTITPGSTSASVPYSYSAADETGYEYRIDGGTAASIGASPATITGLTAATEYDIEVRAINASGAGAWSSISTFTTDAAADTTAPVLTGPTGAATGATAASGAVTTDEANGTLYAVVTTSATPPSAADIRAGTGAAYATSQAVSATGVQSVAATGLTASTAYYWHFLHDDAAANASNIATSASFTTDAIPAGVTVTEPLKNNTGTLLASQSGVTVAVLQAADLVSVHEQSGLTTDASGLLPMISDAAIVPGTSYHVMIKLADGGVGITGPITAS